MPGLTKPTVSEVFNGQSCIILFDEVADYSTATVATIVGSGVDLGQILSGSTEWAGEDPSFDNVVDEQGDVIVPNPTVGTYGLNFFMADFSAAKLTTLMHGRTVTITSSDMAGTVFKDVDSAVAVGDRISVITRPVALVNDESNKAILFPKARILTGPGMEDKLFGLRVSVMAQDCTTDNLGTMMYIPTLSLGYAASAASTPGENG